MEVEGVKKLYVDGQPMEVWENPDFAFNTDPDTMSIYYRSGAWELLFNAIILNSMPSEGS